MRGVTQSDDGLVFNVGGLFWMVHIPEVALFGVDEADNGVLFVGISRAHIGALAAEVFKLHAHCHWVSVRLGSWRHGALNALICFPTKERLMSPSKIL